MDEQSDGPKRWIGRDLIETLLATAAVIGRVLIFQCSMT